MSARPGVERWRPVGADAVHGAGHVPRSLTPATPVGESRLSPIRARGAEFTFTAAGGTARKQFRRPEQWYVRHSDRTIKIIAVYKRNF